jgi:hypothetical protein
MLRQLTLIVALTLTLTSTASWARNAENSYCRGYIVKALAEYPMDGLPITQLWLSWYAVVARTGSEGKFNESEYQAGRDEFDSLFAAGNTSALTKISNKKCDMGRN